MVDIKRFREEKKISQKELCEVLGVKQPYLSAIENGVRPLNKAKLAILYKQYGDIVLGYKLPDIIIDRPDAPPAHADTVSIPMDVWEVIKTQAESLKAKDEQNSKIIEMLQEQLKKTAIAVEKFRAVN